jgi:hypothetical protein
MRAGSRGWLYIALKSGNPTNQELVQFPLDGFGGGKLPVYVCY